MKSNTPQHQNTTTPQLKKQWVKPEMTVIVIESGKGATNLGDMITYSS